MNSESPIDPFKDALRRGNLGYAELIERMANTQERIGALSPKLRALIGFSLNVSVSQMNHDAALNYAKQARRAGATREELIQAAQITYIGIHAVILVADLVVDSILGASQRGPLDARQEEVRQNFERDRGWPPPPNLEDVIRMDADFFDFYRQASTMTFSNGILSRKDAELIAVAVDVSVNHLHSQGARLHAQLALEAGASPAELVEVLEIASVMAAQGPALGFQIANDLFDYVE